ncbi:MAG: AAA family ATPase, partial [Monoglobus pectinilyticus]
TIPLVQNNPYILADQIDGITFDKADEIAMSLGFETKSYVRIASGIKSIIKRISFLNGHTYLPRPTIIAQAVSMLEVEQGPVEDAISQLLLSGELISENQGDYDAIYLKLFYDAEREVAEKLIRMSGVTFDIDISQIDNLIDKVESEDRIELSENQREAVRRAFQTAALVITGGPGTGKTTIINTIINAMKIEHNKVMLAAPTGRAAKRMSEVCGFEAKTIHRLLEITPGVDEVGSCFARNSENPLDCDVLIIDEMSMVDIILMKHLTDALSSRTRLIMVGDSDQLPSVGAGNVLKDIIDSDSIECIKLTEIFRQAKESMIVVNAHRVNNGEEPLLNDNDNDFFFVHRDDPMQLPNTIADLCVRRLPRYYGLDGITQIQVLTPTRKSLIGVQNLNTILQSCLNPPSPDKKEYITRRCIFRVGDKVMQIKNNYQLEWKRDAEKGLGVFNGDVGFIIDIDSRAQKMTIQFDDKIVVYDFLLLDEIELAYAITVHKSQGSEFDAVVMPMFETHRLLMTRNLFYTAITRAKSLVVLVGQEGVMAQYVNNDNVQRRFSGLKDKLKIF